ncbi:transcription antitermination factor NusB [Alkalilimnicola ehrlichii MLHE-1]|uniref:Transcription antitermination protein NusB n=1 Tax=Alkalilimnicola ehrlichii (strain ATCC BAA-1101 / DSM 17681 / MLHE-1) TaxID=187272 RepID=NUSB_ALKEH|nr:transcription antitermination factor NusB [Alkalilimnicola ehrlichii]Q0ABQ3.1 RecName: Full=Transcription antitermination protein NusB; AltName: Full=Antitermination factor NusB [Alkalilimnicola ehrlichii MLHE-1]ABI55734.1 NusB antitermination factor [Alkalilimnicola ehrlichii MLHE-1]
MSTSESPNTPGQGRRARARARELALLALYQWQMTGQDLGAIEAQHLEIDPEEPPVEAGDDEHYPRYPHDGLDRPYFRALLHGVPARLNDLDQALEPLLDRPLRTLDPLEKALLRLGAWELSERMDTPWRVIINEAVNLAKRFGAEQSHRYINGVLDKLARGLPLRATEIEADRKRRGR